MTLYHNMLDIVKDCGVPEAVTEYQDRFVPLLDQELLQKTVMEAFSAELEQKVAKLEEKKPPAAEPKADTDAAKLMNLIRAGGPESVTAFTNMAARVVQAKGEGALGQWVVATYTQMPKDDQWDLVTVLIRHFLKTKPSA
jgi:hypothetical protein